MKKTGSIPDPYIIAEGIAEFNPTSLVLTTKKAILEALPYDSI